MTPDVTGSLRNLSRMRWHPGLLVCVPALLIGACGNGGSGTSACGPAVEERLDPRSAQHLLPGAAEPTYQTDPPTSGAHIVGNLPRGAQREPLARPVQVALLEVGHIVVQYRDMEDQAALDPLAGDLVNVAPNPELPAAVIATAWQHKLECTGPDVDALRGFIDDRVGKAPGTP
jgi:hypothetical protein